MASNVLRLVFRGAGDKKFAMNFTQAKASPAEVDVKDLGAAMVANKEIYEIEPLELIGAEVIVTTSSSININ